MRAKPVDNVRRVLNVNARCRAAVAVALVGLGTAGCGAGIDGGGAPVLASVVSGSNTALAPLGTADAAAKTQRPSEPSQLAVTGVRVGNHEGFDRVVLDLVGDGEPGWFVDYTPTPMRATVGKTLPVSGNAFLSINVDGTVYPFELGLDSQVPVETAGNTGNIVDVVHGGTHEGRSQVVVGLRSETPYSVQVLQDPKRLVVDILQA